MTIPFVDLKSQYNSIREEVATALQEVLDACSFIGGAPVEGFEREFAAYCGARYAIGVANGTDALHLVLRARGIGPGDEVITAANTFIATAAAIEMAGARPVFVDIDPRTHTLDPERFEAAITPRTRAVIPVHLYGQPADMDPIMEIASRKDLFVVEDAAQAHGAMYKGQRAGSIGHAGCFSFYPGKNLGAYGDGGAITTSDLGLLAKLLQLRDHGRTSKYEHSMVGYNSRLDSMQAAVLSVKLRHLDRWTAQRQQIAAWYAEDLAGSDLELPVVRSETSHVYHLYVVATADRAALQERLSQAGIASGIHYPLPLHLQQAFRHLGYGPGDMPRSEAMAEQILSLPMYPELTRGQVSLVCDVIRGGARAAAVA